MASPPDTLYHFTSRAYLPSIMKQGITRGDIAVSRMRGYCAPTLTESPD